MRRLVGAGAARAIGAGLIAMAAIAPAALLASGPDLHVVSAERLVDQLDLANTSYEHGPGSITWTGTVASHADCFGFVDQLLRVRQPLTARR